MGRCPYSHAKYQLTSPRKFSEHPTLLMSRRHCFLFSSFFLFLWISSFLQSSQNQKRHQACEWHSKSSIFSLTNTHELQVKHGCKPHVLQQTHADLRWTKYVALSSSFVLAASPVQNLQSSHSVSKSHPPLPL